MAVRQIVEDIIKNNPPHSIHVSNRLRLSADLKVEKKRDEWMEARKHALLQRLTRSYGIAIFGSARLDETDAEFKFVSELAKKIVLQRQIDIVTGGGPGIMMAAHKGAKEAIKIAAKDGKTFKAHTFGVNIELPFEQQLNEHIDINTTHTEFTTRLQEFIDKTQGAYIAPGGLGTLLEFSLVLQLKQVEHLNSEYPILVHSFWEPIIKNMSFHMYEKRINENLIPFISLDDLKLIEITDDIEYIAGKFGEGYDKWHEEFKSRQQKVNKILSVLHRIPILFKNNFAN